MVDDPYVFGQIAAANALSDVYAMGGKPITALNIACFPINVIEEEVFSRILLGGLHKMTEAGVALLGGHSIDDKEIKYGLSVTGICDINKIYSNQGAKPGDILCLTKKLGTGFVVSAICKDFLEQDTLNEAELSMSKLNKYASELAVSSKFPNAMTDITGFGLAGHLSEMMIASDTCCEINLSSLPVISGTMELINKGVNPAGTKRNREYFSKYVSVTGGLDEILLQLAFGAETSGGLIFAVPEVKMNDLKNLFGKEEEPLYEIGRVLDKNTNSIYIKFL
ncbi:MAG TPA: selenide, water dikinase SelD [bacterium]|nr:selenide, water dikinase SelD [bacterium]